MRSFAGIGVTFESDVWSDSATREPSYGASMACRRFMVQNTLRNLVAARVAAIRGNGLNFCIRSLGVILRDGHAIRELIGVVVVARFKIP